MKLTATDIIIPNNSRHPPEHKLSAIRYLTTRLSTYPMNETEKRKENDTIKQMFVFGATAPLGQGILIHEISRSHTTHHSW